MFHTILVAVDATDLDDAQKILAAVKRLTSPWGATLHVTTIVPDTGMSIVGSQFNRNFESESRESARQELKAAFDQVELEAEIHVLSGKVLDRVVRLANKLETDLIILGAPRTKPSRHIFQSIASRLVEHTKGSVLVLRS